MEGREADYAFSKPYMHNEQVVVVKKDSGINSLDDLADKNVMTQVDSAALDVLEGDQKDLADTFAGGKTQTIGDYNNASCSWSPVRWMPWPATCPSPTTRWLPSPTCS